MSKAERIFIVDDEPDIVSLYSDILRIDYDVYGFTDPKDLLAFLKGVDYEPDCIISDFNMPSMNGIQLTKTLRGENCHTPVLLMSAHLDKDLSITACNAGVFAILEKPFNIESMKSLLLNAIELHVTYTKNREFKATAEHFVASCALLMKNYRDRAEDAERLLRGVGLLPKNKDGTLHPALGVEKLEEFVLQLQKQLSELHEREDKKNPDSKSVDKKAA